MDAIVNELKAMGGLLHYNEKKLLERGDVDGCLSVFAGRVQRSTGRQLAFFLVSLWFPIIMLIAGRLVEGSDFRIDAYFLILAPLLATAGGQVPAMLQTSRLQSRIETLALLWRMTNAGEKSVGRAA